MPKFPIEVDGKTIEVQVFTDGEEHIVLLDDRYYKMWRVPNSDSFYFMVKVNNHQRSVRGTREKCIEMMTKVHAVYKQYDNRVLRTKEEAQRHRDKALNEIAELSQ